MKSQMSPCFLFVWTLLKMNAPPSVRSWFIPPACPLKASDSMTLNETIPLLTATFAKEGSGRIVSCKSWWNCCLTIPTHLSTLGEIAAVWVEIAVLLLVFFWSYQLATIMLIMLGHRPTGHCKTYLKYGLGVREKGLSCNRLRGDPTLVVACLMADPLVVQVPTEAPLLQTTWHSKLQWTFRQDMNQRFIHLRNGSVCSRGICLLRVDWLLSVPQRQ